MSGEENQEPRGAARPAFPSVGKAALGHAGQVETFPGGFGADFPEGEFPDGAANACRSAGLPHFTHHSLRHFFCSNAIEAGIDFKVIAGWLGHKDGGILVAKTYGHLRDEHSAAMAKRMTFEVGAGWAAKTDSTRRACGGNALGRKTNELLAGLRFRFLQMAKDGAHVVAVLCGQLIAHPSHFLDNRIVHRS